MHTSLIPALQRQKQRQRYRQGDLSEFEASMGLKSKFQDSQGYTEKRCLKKQNKS